MIYFDLDSVILKENCQFHLYVNKTDVIQTVLNGGNKIILANWPNNKHIICSINNDIRIRIPSYPNVLVNRTVLCNCGIEASLYDQLTYKQMSTTDPLLCTILLV